eukprot:scaffold56457_cov70-Phaeocystis_antarctica.AAC.2
MIWLSDPQDCHETTLSRCSTTLLCAGSHDARSATSLFRRAHNRWSSSIEAGRPGRSRDETRPMCASSTSSTSCTSVTPCLPTWAITSAMHVGLRLCICPVRSLSSAHASS